jgi:putative oxidoreductase
MRRDDAPRRTRVVTPVGATRIRRGSSMHARTSRRADVAFLLLRLAVGAVYLVHGAQKLFVFGFDGVAGAFGQMGIPLAGLVGPMVALLEFLGGLALVAGLLTRPVAAGLAATMLGALVLVHLPAGFFMPNGYEFVLALFGAAATLAVTGAGARSLDARLAGRPRAVESAGAERALRRAA